MGWLSKKFGGRGEEEPVSAAMDPEIVKGKLTDLERAITELYRGMSEDACPLDNPGWQGKLRDYAWLRGEVAALNDGQIDRDGIYNLLLSVRPVFPREVPTELAFIEPLQQRVMSALGALRETVG